jgi:hypothetical protein
MLHVDLTLDSFLLQDRIEQLLLNIWLKIWMMRLSPIF